MNRRPWMTSAIAGALIIGLCQPAHAGVMTWLEDYLTLGARLVGHIGRKEPLPETIAPAYANPAARHTLKISGRRLNLPNWTCKAQRPGAAAEAVAITSTKPDGTELAFELPQPIPFPAGTNATYKLFFESASGAKSRSVALLVQEGPVAVTVAPPASWAGELITLSGDYFGPSTSPGRILSDAPTDPNPPPLSWRKTQVTFRVPASWEATTAPRAFQVGVETSTGTASNRVTFRTVPLGPRVKTINPSATYVGRTLQVNGSLFGAATGKVFVQPRGQPPLLVTPDTWSTTRVTFHVPPLTPLPTSADVWLVRADGVRSNTATVVVQADWLPVIQQLMPSTVPYFVPTTVQAIGENFLSPSGGATTCAVIQSGARYPVTVDPARLTNTQLSFTTPVMPRDGWADVEVNVAGRGSFTDVNGLYFDPAAPIITALRPRYVSIYGDESVILTGSRFKAGDTVFIDGTAYPTNVLSPTELECITLPHKAGAVIVEVVRDAGTSQEVRTAWGDDGGEPPLTFAAHVLWAEGAWFQNEQPMTSASWSNFWADQAGLADVLLTHRTQAMQPTYKLSGQLPTETTTTTQAGSAGLTNIVGATWGDVNNDGTLDVLLVRDTALGDTRPVILLTDAPANPDPIFQDVSAAWGLGNIKEHVTAATFFDYDRDGWLDLYLVMDDKDGRYARDQLWRNTGLGRFEAVYYGDAKNGVAVAVTDLNHDHYPDLFVINTKGPNTLLLNNTTDAQRDPKWPLVNPFLDVTSSSGLGTTLSEHTNAAFGDYDLDGEPDVYVTTADGRNTLYHNDGNLTFSPATSQPEEPSGNAWPTADAAWADVDGQGGPELIVANHQARGLRVYYRQSNGDWAELGYKYLRSWAGTATSVAVGSLKDTGRPDLLLSQDAAAPSKVASMVFENKSNVREFFRVRLKGTMSNRAAVDARVALEANDTAHERLLEAASGNEPAASFWFATTPTLDALTVSWPSGIAQFFAGPGLGPFYQHNALLREPDHRLFFVERTGGSLSKRHPVTHRTLWTLPVPEKPTQVTSLPDGRRVFVAANVPGQPAQSYIAIVDVPAESSTAQPKIVGGIPLGAEPVVDLAMSLDGAQLLVLTQPAQNPPAAKLRVFVPQVGAPTPTWTEQGRVPIPGTARHLALAPRGGVAYVVTLADVYYTDLTTLPTPGKLPLAAGVVRVGGAALNVSGDRMYVGEIKTVSAQNQPFLAELALAGGLPYQATLLQEIPLAASAVQVAWVVYDTFRDEVYTALLPSTSNTILRVNPRASSSAAPVQRYPVSAVGTTTAASAAGHKLWMVDANGGIATVFNIRTLQTVPCDPASGAPSCAMQAPADVTVGVAAP